MIKIHKAQAKHDGLRHFLAVDRNAIHLGVVVIVGKVGVIALRKKSRLKEVSTPSIVYPASKSHMHPAQMPTPTALQRVLAQGHRLQVTQLSFLFPEY